VIACVHVRGSLVCLQNKLCVARVRVCAHLCACENASACVRVCVCSVCESVFVCVRLVFFGTESDLC